jgi:hypothetical protein
LTMALTQTRCVGDIGIFADSLHTNQRNLQRFHNRHSSENTTTVVDELRSYVLGTFHVCF